MKSKNIYRNSKFSVHLLEKRMLRFEARKKAMLLPVITFVVNTMIIIIYGTIQLFN